VHRCQLRFETLFDLVELDINHVRFLHSSNHDRFLLEMIHELIFDKHLDLLLSIKERKSKNQTVYSFSNTNIMNSTTEYQP